MDNAQGMEPNDLVWDTGAFYLRAADNSGDKRLYIASNAQVGPCYGYAIGSWVARNAVSEGDVLSCYVDIPLTQTATDTRTLYICDLTNHKASAHVKVMLPDMAEAVTINVKKTIALKGGHWFHYDMTDEEAAEYPDAMFDIEEIRIEPLAVSVIGNVLLALWNSGAFDGKEQPITYDYVDCIRSLQKSFKQRCTSYRKCGCEFIGD